MCSASVKMINPNAIIGFGASNYFSGASQIAAANAAVSADTVIDGEARAVTIDRACGIIFIRSFAHFCVVS
jgi:hypothetical protein